MRRYLLGMPASGQRFQLGQYFHREHYAASSLDTAKELGMRLFLLPVSYIYTLSIWLHIHV